MRKQLIRSVRIRSRSLRYVIAIAATLPAIFCSGNRQFAIQQEPLPEEELIVLTAPKRAERMRPMDENPAGYVTIAAVGDVMMGSWVADVVDEFGCDYPFDSTRSLLAKADVAIANLEAPLTDEGDVFKDKTYTFKVPPGFAMGIRNAGIGIVTLANNHILDYGCTGLENTIKALKANDILFSGAGENRARACEPVFMTIKNRKIAFAGFSMTFPEEFWAGDSSCGTCFPTESLLQKVIEQCRENADVVVLGFHWGAERRNTPKDYQVYIARKSIDLGADLVLGHHPHVLQGIEIYKNRLIAYSLGNFVFGSYSSSARTSAILRVLMGEDGFLYARVYPISVYNSMINFQPRVLRNKERTQVIDELNKISQHLNKGKNVIDRDGFIFPGASKHDTDDRPPLTLRSD